MSENTPSTSTAKKPRRKSEKTRLPTPPPDPTSPDREDFLTYLDSLQKSKNYSRSTSIFAPAVATEDAFEHLERLYKLMEQMLELREQNARLHRRVRDLEHFNNLEKMHKELNLEDYYPELDMDTAFAETILESILSDTKMPVKKGSGPGRLRQSIYRRRNRSGSISGTTEKLLEVGSDRRASTCVDSRLKKTAKVSKWTKVKAAFKWEKAAPTVSDAKSQDSGIAGMVPVNLEVARYLRVPSTSDEPGHSPADSGAAEVSTPGSLSTASSNEDFHRHDLRSPEDPRSSDDEHSHNYIPHSKDGFHKPSKCHKTPWAKMKDIIQTRNSFKKKHRLSSHSDDIQIDIEPCSDNEDVFMEDSDKTKSSPKSSPTIYRRENSSDLPPEIVARYQQAAESILESSDIRRISKWTRVKQAFLPPPDFQPSKGSPQNKTNPNNSFLNPEDENPSAQDEIQHDYKKLQKKLSLEFQEKLTEWERMKQNSPSASNPSSSCGFVEDTKDPAFIKKMEEWEKIRSQPSTKTRPSLQLASEENLPPEFRKKLQEWEKIRKTSGKESSGKKKLSDVPRWKSLSGPRNEHSPTIEYPPISDEFRKKLDEWKQIKSGINTSPSEKEIKSSPRLTRKNSSPKHFKKHKEPTDKELQWFEKELGKIEKEKVRLERERQKFLEREESLTKLRSSVVGGPKKEVLIHTPSGFYRFEGISRKFTRKLYEWEKAQGIGPESSTVALLNTAQDNTSSPKSKSPTNTPPLMRSKSADSIAISALNLTCPLMSHQPSSLSLNDVEDLEEEGFQDSKSSSMGQSEETLGLDEPEAIIVEVEDVYEETAGPLRTYAQKTQKAIYQRQEEFTTMCEGVVPKVRRSESARAQNNYNLIEEIFSVLKNLTDNELEIQKTQDHILGQEKRSSADAIKLKMFDEAQKAMSARLTDKVLKLQEANSHVFSSINRDDVDYNGRHVMDMLEAIQDLSSSIYQLTEKLDVDLSERNVFEFFRESGAFSLNPIIELGKDLRTKMLELRRRLSYICAASDMTAPRRRHSSKKRVKKTISNDSGDSRKNEERIEGRLFTKAETSTIQSQGAIRKRIRYRQKSIQTKTLTDTDEEDEDVDLRKNTHKKLTRTRSVSESNSVNFKILSPKIENAEVNYVVDESLCQKVVVPTETNFVNITPEEITSKSSDSPVTVFVKTTRKLFTPLIESTLPKKKDEVLNPMVVHEKADQDDLISDNQSEASLNTAPITHLPPLPASPTPSRKMPKDISPSIRLMLAKYNQRISEQDQSNKSGGSSGSASPVAWRSPTAERRVKAQTERYQEGLHKLSPLLGGKREVQKSASLGFMHPNQKQITIVPRRDSILEEPHHAVLKSCSASALLPITDSLGVAPPDVEETQRHSPEVRLRKLQKAKEDFLNSGPSTPTSAPMSLCEDSVKFPRRNRLSQISVGSESSCDVPCSGALIKSASVGMINVDAEVYRQFDPEVHGGGYVSLPRSTKKQEGLLGGKFAFSSIASKFRKVKMRRGKDKERDKKSTVLTLCRQSLVVDIQPLLEGASGESKEFSSGEVSSASSKGWIRKAKLFKR